jgi:Leucine-rich repeat (LRR) protein
MEFQVERIRQRFAMALMYCEFNGDNWLEGELWTSDLHECDWYTMIGVDPCGRREQYQIIRNYGQQMRGTLPPELSMMSTLWEVTLSDNLIEGTIPPDYYKLSELDTLGLSFNLFKGPIPDFVWEYEDMVYLDLAYNFFTGTIPDTVHLTEPNLRVLFVENNDLSGTIPTTFGQLDWKLLHLDGNEFVGTIPSDINAPRVEEIMLHNNKLTGTFPAASFATDFAGNKSKLRQVTLHNNDMTGDVNDMCSLFFDGRLQTFEVDLDKMKCDCCTSGI